MERRDNNKGYEPGNCYWASLARQAQNRRTRSDSKTKVLGVNWYAAHDTYIVRIQKDGKRLFLGYARDFFDACCLRKSAEAANLIQG